MRKEKKMELGTVKINNDVIASIARNAALAVDGVASLKVSPISVLAELFNKRYYNQGVGIEVTEQDVRLEITIVVRYGVNIPEIAGTVQDSVRAAIEELTGLNVAEVNVTVGGLLTQKHEAEEQRGE
ncbi:MAG: Asp23/Gls24 family envelope stress response protein [Candidatus Omnitrophica bacterium]|nr:Asp23/Gls24 family envelope stress response protein [Candidatus Omnitrophota bacterium]